MSTPINTSSALANPSLENSLPMHRFHDKGFSGWMPSHSVPAANVFESDKVFIVEMAAPGKSQEDFVVKVKNGMLSVSSEQAGHQVKERPYTHREFNYSSFSRSFPLPEKIDKKDLKARYEDGVLRITLPKLKKVPETEKRSPSPQITFKAGDCPPAPHFLLHKSAFDLNMNTLISLKMLSQIHIQGSRTVREIKEEFAAVFPDLRIDFFHHTHQEGIPSEKADMADAESTLDQIRSRQTEGMLTLDPKMTVADLENTMRDRFGLGVQVFRRSGRLWIQTALTDHWTLEEQQEDGQRSGDFTGDEA